MNREYHSINSLALGRPIELLSFGTGGHAMILFPTSEGRFFNYENRGTIHTMSHWIENKQLRVYCVDSVDSESLFNKQKHGGDKVYRQLQYEDCIMKDVVPFIYSQGHFGRIMVAGFSWGAYHAANFLLKFPDVFDIAISLSGLYTVRDIIGDYYDDNVYFIDPIRYMRGLTDHSIIEKLKTTTLILVVGEGNWESECRRDSWELSNILKEKGINHWLDVWGPEFHHDWDFWHIQFPHILGKILG